VRMASFMSLEEAIQLIRKIPPTVLEIAVDTKITLLKIGRKFSYRVPNFFVLTVDLRQISYQVESADVTQLLFDGFIRFK
jgi:hypothetical protein